MQEYLCGKFDDALVTDIITQVGQDGRIGRTVLQKVVYFLKAKGVPVGYKFDIQHYGPYSQDLYYRMDDLEADEFVIDVSGTNLRSEYRLGPQAYRILEEFKDSLEKYKTDINMVLEMLNGSSSEEMGLLATLHYIYSSHASFYDTPPDKNMVVETVARIKKRFTAEQIQQKYEFLESRGVFTWLEN